MSPIIPVEDEELISRSNPLLRSLLERGIDPSQELDKHDVRAESRKPLLMFLLREYDRDYLTLRHAPLVDLMLPWSVLTVIGWGVLWAVIKLHPPVSGPLWRFWSLMAVILVLSGAICAVLIGVPVALRRRRRARILLRAFQAECIVLGATHEEIDDAVRFGCNSGWCLARWA